MPDLLAAVRDFSRLRALVVGDVMLDEYLWGDVERISPEAPVPVVALRDRVLRPGGAANVALNVAALGAGVTLIGLRGDDEAGVSLGRALREAGLDDATLVATPRRRTTRKARVMSGGQQLLRVDTEDTHPADAEEVELAWAAAREAAARHRPDVIVLEDYDKGALTPELIARVTELARSSGIPVAVDPKARNFWAYRGVALFKPNLKELTEALPALEGEPELNARLDAGHEALRERLAHERSLVTLGAGGAYLRSGTGAGARVAAHPREVADVCGAGDSVIAVASLALAGGLPDASLLGLANLAGGLACEHVGVRPVRADELAAGIAAADL